MVSLLITIPCNDQELNLDISLQCGQAFRWIESMPRCWTGMILNKVWTFSQNDKIVYCLLHNLTQNNDSVTDKQYLSKSPKSPLQNRTRNLKKLDQKNLIFVDNEMVNDFENSLRKYGYLFEDINSENYELSASANEFQTRSSLQRKETCSNNFGNSLTSTSESVSVQEKCSPTFEAFIIDSKFVNSDGFDIYICRESKYVKRISDITDPAIHFYFIMIKSYFRLDVNLRELYKQWSQNDAHFSEAASTFPGIRMLDQPPVENVFSFICSSNNNINRISQLVEKLCLHFGKFECNIWGKDWYSFPSVSALAENGVESKLRLLGFGYRAAYITKSAERIKSFGGEDWLKSLRTLPYRECHQQLRSLAGVGPKVADCICLMSMNQLSSVPVDTHVFQVAARYYLPQLKIVKTVNNTVYQSIADHFRAMYGPLAGWAQSVLFAAELKKFDDQKPYKKLKLT